ncbi:MAG: carbohydrate-binding domain-containing protein [Ruminococcus sp.]|nr:carbohydrate-binding domain-containing protein [Ruminococcus sp.]
MKRLLPILLALALMCSMLAGCEKSGSGDETSKNNSSNNTDSTTDSEEVGFTKTDSDMFTDRDFKTDYDEKNSILIQLNGSSATASSKSVQISGSTITITEDATYIISGTLDDGMIIVDAPDTAKMQMVLNGVNINSKTSAPIYILEADKVFITLADGTENTLSNGGTFTAIDENNIDSVIFSKQDLTINGSGSLTVTSPAGHGIVSKDDLVITGGTYNVASASHGLDANDSVRIAKASLTIDAGKDGIHAENSDDDSRGFVYISSGTIKVESEGDGISAGAYMQVENGTINVVAGGGSENGSKTSSDFYGGFMGRGRPDKASSSTTTTDDNSTSMKGLKSADKMLISNGNITINSADDSIHSNVSVTINGGTFELASGDDGIHADETLTITEGKINITESYEGLEALHVDIQGGDIKLVADDDGINAAGGTDSSGTTGGRDGMFSKLNDANNNAPDNVPGDIPNDAPGNAPDGGAGGGPGGRPDGGPGGNRGGMGGGMSSSSNGTIVISGGNIYVKASGDGIDANGTLTISGGYIVIVGPTQGDTSTLDYDVSGTITGGTFIGTGASNMAQSFSDSEQGVIAISVGNQNAETQITITDKNGKEIISHAPELPFQVVIVSSPDIVSGDTYTVTVGSLSSEIEAS